MQTEGIGQTGLGPTSDFPDCSGVELDGWQAYSHTAPNHAFQTHDLPDLWSTVQPRGCDHNLTPELSSLDQLSSFEVYPPQSCDTTLTGDDTATLQDAFQVNATPWTGDTFSYFYGSQYNPFGCAFHDIYRETTADSHGDERTGEAMSHMKPSYSEIAKSTLCGNLSKKTSEECVIGKSVSEPIRKSKSSTHPKSHTFRHVPFDPVPINPGSAYGLDTFVTPRHVLKDRQGSQHTVGSVVAPRKHKCGDACVQYSVDPFVMARPIHKDRCVNVPSQYGLDSFDVPLHARHRQSSSTESGFPRVDSVNVSFNDNRFDVNDFCHTQSFGTYELHSGDRNQNTYQSTCTSTNVFSSTTDHVVTVQKSAAGLRRETTDDENCDTSQKHPATLNGLRTATGDNKLSAHDRKRSRSRTKPSASNTSESNDNNKQSAHSRRQSASKSRQSACHSKQLTDSKRHESTCKLNNSKPLSSNGCAFRPWSVDQINNNVRDGSKAKEKTRNNNIRENSKVRGKSCNNNVRDDNKTKDRTCNNLQDDSQVKDKTRNNVRDDSKVTNRTCNNNNVQDDNKVTDGTRSSGQAKTSKRTAVVETKVDYLELMEQLQDSCTRAGQYVLEVLKKSTLTVLCLLWLIIKDLFLLADSLIVYLSLVCQSLIKKVMDKCCQRQQRGNYTPPPRTNGNSTQWPRSGGNIELPTTGDEAVRRLLSCDVKNPYSVLGIGVDASDEDIKRFYRRQAILVHPDKNHQVGSEEAFKILQNAFDIIGDPEKLHKLRRTQEAEYKYSQEPDAAMKDFVDQLIRLRKEMKEAADRLMCGSCGGTHLRVATDRCTYAARYCSSCYEHHSAREDDLWAETGYSFCYNYFACMEGVIYNITEWAVCQGKLRDLKPNLHRVQVHLKTRPRNRTREKELDELLRQFDPSTYNQGPSCNNHNFPDNAWKPKSKKQRRKRKR